MDVPLIDLPMTTMEVVSEKNKDNSQKKLSYPHIDDSLNPLLGNSSTNETHSNLIEPDEKENKPPLAGPEIDDLDDPPETDNQPANGIDDGFFTPDVSKEGNEPDAEDIDDVINTVFNIQPRVGGDDDDTDHTDGGTTVPVSPNGGSRPGEPPKYPGPGNFPYAPGFGPNVNAGFGPNIIISDDGVITLPTGERIPDVNVYQHKKTLAQGMMDLALFSANANQLRYVLESATSHPYYYPSVIMISISIIFQIAVGIGLIWNSRYNVKDQKEICIANKINNFTVIGIFIVTVVNVFISAFGVAPQNAT